MIQLKPYFIETKNYLFTYHGGGFSPEHLQDAKRANITKYSKASQKRLVLYLETVQAFNPTYLLFLQFPNIPDFDEATKYLKSFVRSLSNPKYNKNKIPALFVWKKCVYQDCLVFEIMTNLNTTLPSDLFVEHMRYCAKQLTPVMSFDALIIDDDNTDLIKTDFVEYRKDVSSTKDDSTGRWWGVINRSYYKCKEPEKKEASLNKIVSKEMMLEDDNKISNNVFYKKK